MKKIIYDDNILKDFLQNFNFLIGNPDDFIKAAKKQQKRLLMLNLLYWYVDLADKDVPDAAKMAFLIAMAEANIKARDGRFDNDDNSSNDVKCFFDGMEINFKQQLVGYFKKTEPTYKDTQSKNFNIVRTIVEDSLSFDEIVNILLNVRHRFMHGKNIYSFRFNNLPENLIYLLKLEQGTREKKEIKIESTLSYDLFRKIMICTALENIKNTLD